MKTKLAVYTSASAFALANIQTPEGRVLESKMHDAFEAEGGREQDWKFWSQTVRCQHSFLTSLSKQPSDSEAAAIAKAKADERAKAAAAAAKPAK